MSEQTSFKRSLGLVDATMIVAGSMIGSGIFIVSADITRNVGSSGWLIAVWLLTGFMTISAALSYGELSAMFPKAGGQYIYLKEAYNPLVGFLFGWAVFMVIQTGAIAAIAIAFAKYAGELMPSWIGSEQILFQLAGWRVSTEQLTAILLISFLTWNHMRGVKNGKWIQNVFTMTKIIALSGLIFLDLYVGWNSAA